MMKFDDDEIQKLLQNDWVQEDENIFNKQIIVQENCDCCQHFEDLQITKSDDSKYAILWRTDKCGNFTDIFDNLQDAMNEH